MRRRNWRLVLTGIVLIILALVFYFLMLSSASSSTGPAALMEIVGGIAGAAFGVSILFILIGLIGKKA
jgi:hypothetical protein